MSSREKMEFRRVRFNNFRNIAPREIKWSGGLNLLTGPNGSGKTNILEGINIISGWGPLGKGTKMSSIPTWNSGSDTVQLTGQLDDEDGDIIQIRISGRFSAKIRDKAVTSAELRRKIPVLSFIPNDMSLLEGSSVYRRRLLDMMLILLVPPYAQRLRNFRNGIRQKSVMLHRGEQTFIVDRALAPLASWIWKMREETVNLLNSCMPDVRGLLPAEDISLSLKRGGGGFYSEPEDDFRAGLAAEAEHERMLRTPVVGPHRDDMVIKCGDKLASETLSRGFRRRTAIALMLAASDGVRRKLGINPVLLLDEVTAELDKEGRRLLFDSLISRCMQVFAATAEPFPEVFDWTVYRIEKGEAELKNDEDK